MNCVFNEHPSRLITETFIARAVQDARASFDVSIACMFCVRESGVMSLMESKYHKGFFSYFNHVMLCNNISEILLCPPVFILYLVIICGV